MKRVFILWHDTDSWTFFSTDIDSAKEKGKRVCKERGWKYHGVTPRWPILFSSPHPSPLAQKPNEQEEFGSVYDQIERIEFSTRDDS